MTNGDGRFGQNHIFKYILAFGICTVLIVFEDGLIFLYESLLKLMKRCKEKHCCNMVKKQDWFPDPVPKKYEREELY